MNATCTAPALNTTAARMEADTARREAEARPAAPKPRSFSLATATDMVTFTPLTTGTHVRVQYRSRERKMLTTAAARAEWRRLILAGYKPW